MTDLDLTKACAEAMGYTVEDSLGDLVRVRFEYRSFTYRPLHDDAQAMALVKRFRLECDHWGDPNWVVSAGKDGTCGKSIDLNRAIVECVAKLKERQ